MAEKITAFSNKKSECQRKPDNTDCCVDERPKEERLIFRHLKEQTDWGYMVK
jgi:hypothetical protein